MNLKFNIDAGLKYNLSDPSKTSCGAVIKIAGGTVLGQHTPNVSSENAVQGGRPFLRSCLQNAPEAFIVTSSNGSIQLFNRRAESLFGYSEDEIRGRNFSSLLEPGFQPDRTVLSMKPDASSWAPVAGEGGNARGLKKSGELFPAEIQRGQCTLLSESVHVYYIRDISLICRQEQHIAELEREIAHLARNSLLGELATSITHELSQPLTAMSNYTAAACRCGLQASPAGMEHSLDLIAKAGEQAKRAWLIMHRLRHLLQHRGAERSVDDLRLAVDDAVQLATLGAEHQGIVVTVALPQEPVTVSMDRVQIQVLLANLIRNAVDELRTIEGERRIWIRLSINEQGMAEFSVEDTGNGIAPEDFESLFDPFHTTKPEGLGVGLALSRRIAQAHGGRLAAANRPVSGAIFTFVIPLSE